MLAVAAAATIAGHEVVALGQDNLRRRVAALELGPFKLKGLKDEIVLMKVGP